MKTVRQVMVEGVRSDTEIHPYKPKDADDVEKAAEIYGLMLRRCKELTEAAGNQLANVAMQCSLLSSAVRKFDVEEENDSMQTWMDREDKLTELHNVVWRSFENVADMIPMRRKGGVR